MKNNKHVVVNKVGHSRKFLSGIFHVLICYVHKGKSLFINNSYVEDPRLQASGMTPLFNNSGFTLIELLVVVLIIGILAAVAVPQYQKAVIKSQNAEMKQVVKAVADAEQTYFLANGKYAADFNELDIDLPLTSVKTTIGGTTGSCATHIQGTDSARKKKDYYIALNSTDIMTNMSVVAYWSSGTYRCAGFGRSLSNAELNILHCREHKSIYKDDMTGMFCEKLEQGKKRNSATNYYWIYDLP